VQTKLFYGCSIQDVPRLTTGSADSSEELEVYLHRYLTAEDLREFEDSSGRRLTGA
jgi:hypothetical protein